MVGSMAQAFRVSERDWHHRSFVIAAPHSAKLQMCPDAASSPISQNESTN
jgi:hypothetical protein